MTSLNGSGLTPLFHSEITSSYMLYDIFSTHAEVACKFIEDTFHISPENILVHRERSYPKKGSIDLFMEFTLSAKKSALLIEVKVHDYFSATDNQIGTYYNAVLEDSIYEEVYFVYLTQFNANTSFTDCAAPRTIEEARKGQILIGGKFAHISWTEMHSFLERFEANFPEEQRLILNLQKTWIAYQNQIDLENNRVDVGTRSLDEYFSDIQTDIRVLLPFGREVNENRRQIWRVDVSTLNLNQLEVLLDVILRFTLSENVNRIRQYRPEESTIQGAADFLTEMAQSGYDWIPLSFYARLFDLMKTTSYIKFNGTGTRGFSIKVEIKGKGEISLCTIYRIKTIDFSMKR